MRIILAALLIFMAIVPFSEAFGVDAVESTLAKAQALLEKQSAKMALAQELLGTQTTIEQLRSAVRLKQYISALYLQIEALGRLKERIQDQIYAISVSLANPDPNTILPLINLISQIDAKIIETTRAARASENLLDQSSPETGNIPPIMTATGPISFPPTPTSPPATLPSPPPTSPPALLPPAPIMPSPG
jgi:hypothetical protein